MGCECCKIQEHSQYEKCQELSERLKLKHKSAPAPCGGCDIGFVTSGSNYTPPKKKRKKRK